MGRYGDTRWKDPPASFLPFPFPTGTNTPPARLGRLVSVEVERLSVVGDLAQATGDLPGAHVARLDLPGRPRRSGGEQRRPGPGTGAVALASWCSGRRGRRSTRRASPSGRPGPTFPRWCWWSASRPRAPGPRRRHDVPEPVPGRQTRLVPHLTGDLSGTHVEQVQGVAGVGHLIGPEVGAKHHPEQALLHAAPGHRRPRRGDGRPLRLATFGPGAGDGAGRKLLNRGGASERGGLSDVRR